MKTFRILFFLFVTALIATVKVRGQESLSFPGYGPIAFESFWRPTQLDTSWLIHARSRISYSNQSQFFTQYLDLNAPLGRGHSLIIRAPWHHFSLSTPEQIRQNAERKTGSSLGDIDFIFNVHVLSFLSRKWNNKILFYLSAELHTAPTGRGDRQFTDTIKMLGTFITQFNLYRSELWEAKFTLTAGLGGWQEETLPRQNHIVKVAPQALVTYHFRKVTADLSVAVTALSGERSNDQGVAYRYQWGLRTTNLVGFCFTYGRLQYTESIRQTTDYFELGILKFLNI